MKCIDVKPRQTFEEAYLRFNPIVLGYFRKRLIHKSEAEDLTQDVFVKLLDIVPMLRKDTISSLIFTIARNLLIDYNRRFYKRMEIERSILESSDYTINIVEEKIAYNELRKIEKTAMARLTRQRCIVYKMYVHDGCTYKEIANQLNLSPRTIEKHLLSGRSEVREYILACV